jgi:hypothetical protein
MRYSSFELCLDILPKYEPEQLNIAAVILKQLGTEAAIKQVSEAVAQLLLHVWFLLLLL